MEADNQASRPSCLDNRGGVPYDGCERPRHIALSPRHERRGCGVRRRATPSLTQPPQAIGYQGPLMLLAECRSDDWPSGADSAFALTDSADTFTSWRRDQSPNQETVTTTTREGTRPCKNRKL